MLVKGRLLSLSEEEVIAFCWCGNNRWGQFRWGVKPIQRDAGKAAMGTGLLALRAVPVSLYRVTFCHRRGHFCFSLWLQSPVTHLLLRDQDLGFAPRTFCVAGVQEGSSWAQLWARSMPCGKSGSYVRSAWCPNVSFQRRASRDELRGVWYCQASWWSGLHPSQYLPPPCGRTTGIELKKAHWR